jgi:surface carbohydrate biosynthesis protein
MKDNNNLRRMLGIFFKSKINFTFPKKKEIVLYDRFSSYLLENFHQDKLKYIILPTRSETFNFYALLLMLLNLKINREEYIKSFIYLFRPKLIISSSEHDLFFYKLKKYFPHIEFVMVQNGARSKNYDFFDLLKKEKFLNSKLEIDYFFVFSKYYAEELKKFIKFKSKILGSFKCNNIPIKKFNVNKKSVIFISAFKKQFKVNNKIIPANCSSKLSNNYYVEKFIVPILFEFCKKNNYKFKILLRNTKEKSKDEISFFLNLVKNNKNCLIYKSLNKSSYEIIDNFENIVFIDSTLGFEAIARGKKVVSIFSRKFENNWLGDFLWPKNGPKSSNFFTFSNNKNEIIKIFRNNFNLPNNHWININKNYIRDLIVYQKNNRDFYSLLNKILYN